MRKKIFISIFMLWALSFMLSAKVSAQSFLLGMIEVKFCNFDQTNKELDLVSQAGNTLPICVEFTNKSVTPVTLNIEFLDSVITSDNIKDRACNASDRSKTQFGNFMLPYSWAITLPAKQTIQKEYSIKHPIGFSWLSHGCLAYNLVWGDINGNDMFTIRIRSIKYVDIFVSDTQAVQMIYVSQSPILKKLKDEWVVTLWVNNRGNVDEKIHVTNVISNMFGYYKDFILDATVPANTGILLTTPSFILPAYGWPFWFTSKISYTPEFNFNITSGKHPSQIYAGGTRKIRTILFVWTRQSRTTIFVLLTFVFLIYWGTKKKKQIVKKMVKKSPK